MKIFIKTLFIFFIPCLIFSACEKKEAKKYKQEEPAVVYESIVLTEEEIEQMNMYEFLLGSWLVSKIKDRERNEKEVWINSSIPAVNSIFTFNNDGTFTNTYTNSDYIQTGIYITFNEMKSSDRYDSDKFDYYELHIKYKYDEDEYYGDDSYYDSYEVWRVQIIDKDNIIMRTSDNYRSSSRNYCVKESSQVLKILNDDNLNEMKNYLKSGNSIDEKIFGDYTLLMYAIICGKTKIAHCVLEEGADISLRSSIGYNSFQYAVLYSKYEDNILKKILESGIDINETDGNYYKQTALDLTIIDNPDENTKKIQRLLIENGAVCSQPDYQREAENGAYLIKLFSQYRPWTSCIAFSPDGKTIISGDDDGDITVWNALTGEDITFFRGHAEWVRCLSYSSDGKYILSACFSTTKTWDAHTLKEIRVMNYGAHDADSARFSPDGNFIVSSDNKDVVLLNAGTGREVRKFKQHKIWGIVTAFSPDGKLIASGGKEENKLWETDTGKLIWTVQGHDRTASSITFSPDGSIIASAGEDHKIILLETATGKLIRTLPNGSNWTNLVRFTRDGKILVSASTGKALKFWEVSTGELIKEIRGFYDEVYCFGFSPDETQLISSSRDGHIKLWDISWLKNYKSFKRPTVQVPESEDY